MTIELKIPEVAESIQEMQIGQWLKQEGDRVEEDENVVELETDKASMELPSPADGVIQQILKKDGESVSVGETIAYLEEGENGAPADAEKAEEKSKAEEAEATEEAEEEGKEKESEEEEEAKADQEVVSAKQKPEESKKAKREAGGQPVHATPSGRRALQEHGLSPADVKPEGKRIRRQDVLRHVQQKKTEGDGKSREARETKKPSKEAEREEVVPMSLIRRRIASRLVEAQQKAALLTTFNEIDMSAVIDLRKSYGERFQKKYGLKLGFMSFFVKASIDALKEFPDVNAEIRDKDIVYRNYFHIGVAIGGERGLVVPVLRNAERMSFAEIEESIADFAARAQENKLEPDELEGGTFTISNGGIYGSLLSTPIVNPPQSGVLGMHAIEDRPVARSGEVVIRPMMYIALTYDHRIIDGRGAVSFLRRIKETIEQPARMLIEV